METKHTPGPWINQDMLITAGPNYNNFGRICEVSMDDSEFDLETTKANARLIAAAPQLLEALEELHAASLDNDQERMYQARADAREIIALATGSEVANG